MKRRLLFALGIIAGIATLWAADAEGWPLSLPLFALSVVLLGSGAMREDQP